MDLIMTEPPKNRWSSNRSFLPTTQKDKLGADLPWLLTKRQVNAAMSLAVGTVQPRRAGDTSSNSYSDLSCKEEASEG